MNQLRPIFNQIKRLPTFLACILSIALSGCETVESFEKFYRPYTVEVYPQKPKDAQIPLLGVYPKQKFVIIGRMGFKSGKNDYDFLLKAVEHKARKVGADAVVIADSHTTSQPYTYTVPEFTTMKAVTTYGNSTSSYYGSNGSGYGVASGTSTTYVPVTTGGYTGTGITTQTAIIAYMLRFQ